MGLHDHPAGTGRGPLCYKTVIEIPPGTYREKLVSDKRDVTLIGAGTDKTTIIYGDAGKTMLEEGRKRGTFRSATAFFSGEKLCLRQLSIINDAGYGSSIGQAVALYVDAREAKLECVALSAHQDTLFLASLPPEPREREEFYGSCMLTPRKMTTTLLKDCAIEGNVDFIFGGGDVLFEHCSAISNGAGYVIATSGWSSTTAATERISTPTGMRSGTDRTIPSTFRIRRGGFLSNHKGPTFTCAHASAGGDGDVASLVQEEPENSLISLRSIKMQKHVMTSMLLMATVLASVGAMGNSEQTADKKDAGQGLTHITMWYFPTAAEVGPLPSDRTGYQKLKDELGIDLEADSLPAGANDQSSKLLADLSDTYSKMPGRTSMMFDAAIKYTTYSDEKNYGWATPSSVNPNEGLVIRKDWLDKLGLQVPETLDDFYNIMYAFTYNNPDGDGKDDTYGFGAYIRTFNYEAYPGRCRQANLGGQPEGCRRGQA